MPAPRYLFADWNILRPRLARASCVALFLDFDGTLAPIRLRPESVSLPGSVRSLLKRIAQSGVCVAIITGRGLADVRRRVDLNGVWYAGSHGYFLLAPKGCRLSLLTKQQRANIQRVLRSIRPALRSVPGIQIEPKDATISVHYRRAKPSAVRSALVVVRQAVKSNPGLKLMHGKKIWEILPAAPVDKWTAARFILQKQFSSRRDLLLFYLGDDTTDETVFRKMQGISVVIGRKKATAARYFLRSHSEVKQFLKRWAQLTN